VVSSVEDGGCKFLRNFGIHLPNYNAPHLRRQKCSRDSGMEDEIFPEFHLLLYIYDFHLLLALPNI
jgi:hypothetical protein